MKTKQDICPLWKELKMFSIVFLIHLPSLISIGTPPVYKKVEDYGI